MPGNIWIHIQFTNGSNPKVYFKKSFAEACTILREWEKNWKMERLEGDYMFPFIWYFEATEKAQENYPA